VTYNIIDTINATSMPTEPMSTLIPRAQAGDKDASLQVLRAHMHILVAEIDRATKIITRPGFAPDTSDLRDDIAADAFQVFYRALAVYDPAKSNTGRFGSLLHAALRRDERFNSAVNRVRPFRVPDQTAHRRAAAIKAAGGDIVKARARAREFGISVKTFDAVSDLYDAGVSMNNDDAPTGMFSQRETGYVHVEDLHDVARALDVLDPERRLIVEATYGLNGQPEQSQSAIAEMLGMNRRSVARRLESAMLTMQSAFNPEETK
jgi:DNA-directed RNA polymerase specialized sigma24 family protein